MTEQQIQEIADQVIEALNKLAPVDPEFSLVDLGPLAVFTAAAVAAFVGWRNLLHQQKTLKASARSDARNLSQKRQADARSEWWKRTQWALEASSSDNTTMYAYGAGLLDLLAESDLAGPEDKALLDAVWETGDTGMQDDDIMRLIEDARDQDLTYDEMLSVLSYDPEVSTAYLRLQESSEGLGYDDLVAMLRKTQEGRGGETSADLQHPAKTVDDSSAPGDNVSKKEVGDDEA